jgi:hypothetical protein
LKKFKNFSLRIIDCVELLVERKGKMFYRSTQLSWPELSSHPLPPAISLPLLPLSNASSHFLQKNQPTAELPNIVS